MKPLFSPKHKEDVLVISFTAEINDEKRKRNAFILRKMQIFFSPINKH